MKKKNANTTIVALIIIIITWKKINNTNNNDVYIYYDKNIMDYNRRRMIAMDHRRSSIISHPSSYISSIDTSMA